MKTVRNGLVRDPAQAARSVRNTNSRTLRSTWVARLHIGSAALALLVGCGSGVGAALEIRHLNPSSIGARTPDFNIAVRGAGFSADTRVVLGDTELRTLGHSSTLLVAAVPGGTAGTTAPGVLSVSVREPSGARSNQLTFVVGDAAAPVISGIDSNLCIASGNTLGVTLVGDNFTTDTRLESSGKPLAIAVRSSSSIAFSVPLEDGTYSFKVTVPPPGGGEASIDYAPFLLCD